MSSKKGEKLYTIELAPNFAIKRDTYGWVLIEYKEGTNRKTKDKIITEHYRYYPKLHQILSETLDVQAGYCKDIQELHNLLHKYLEAVSTNEVENIFKEQVNGQ